MRSVSVISLHTSPLAQPGTGDGGGMNVYVRELSSAMARLGAECDVFTRASKPSDPPVVEVEPGFRLHNVVAGPAAPLGRQELPSVVEAFSQGVLARIAAGEVPSPDAIYSHYWLSGLAGHWLKHQIDVPLLSTFHTLARVKHCDATEPSWRAEAEAEIIGCSDAVVVSTDVEADQVASLYGSDPGRTQVVSPGVDHAFYGPGDRDHARRALGLPAGVPLLLFVGRIQPLKRAGVAIHVLAELSAAHPDAHLAVVGGPSGPEGAEEMRHLVSAARDRGVADRVHMRAACPHELLSTYYRAADVCLVPSRSESFGLVALEAAACGVPVVASAVDGLTHLVDHGKTGYLVEGGDAGQFVAYTHQVLAAGDALHAMSAAARRRAGSYTWSSTAVRLLAVLDDLDATRLVACH